MPEPSGDAATHRPRSPFTYTEGRFDAEALIVEPDGSAAIIITKGLDAPATIFELPLRDPPPETQVLTPVGGLELGLITAGDITADGLVIGLRQLDRILLWDRIPGQSIAETIQKDTYCEAPSAQERQGEAFAFHPMDGVHNLERTRIGNPQISPGEPMTTETIIIALIAMLAGSDQNQRHGIADGRHSRDHDRRNVEIAVAVIALRTC